ncbi:hypothetical protein OTK49_28410 [Vibrio coralliirubri]|uniref:hypothetical protein n=1 Tax=Vibrio coralliirubri TaxID=1516159 RepID=UPI0022834D00|nr:hypothetical protein [Vibrio coralliirubri]MCY9866467.1 hypothetical protein [Vibrio coralliirubri]
MRKSNALIHLTDSTKVVSFKSGLFSTVYHQNYIDKKTEQLADQLDKISNDSGFTTTPLDGLLAWFQYVDSGINNGIKKLESEKAYRDISNQIVAPLKNIEFGESCNILTDIMTANSNKQLTVALRDAREFLHLLIFRICFHPLNEKQEHLEHQAA